MNRILVIYDNTGFIVSQMSGAVREPVGIPFMWVDVPDGKYVVRIDVSTETHTPVFEDCPKSEIDQLKEQIDALTIAMAEILGA